VDEVADEAGSEDEAPDEAGDEAGDEAPGEVANEAGDDAPDEGNCEDAGPDEGTEAVGAFVESATLLDSDASFLWPLVAARATETPTATVSVPATMRAGRLSFRGVFAGGWSLMTFSLPGAGRFRV
jgi:hypothetical protein